MHPHTDLRTDMLIDGEWIPGSGGGGNGPTGDGCSCGHGTG